MRINSIFESISGEAGFFLQGTWCTFIRLQGCNQNCTYCDTVYAQQKEGGEELSVKQIIDNVNTHHVLITGGEPLYQDISELILELKKLGKSIQIETNGTLRPPKNSELAYWVVDIKTPFSKVSSENQLNLFHIWKYIPTVFKLVTNFSSEEDINFTLNTIQIGINNHFASKFLISPLNADVNQINNVVNRIKQLDPNLLKYVVFSIQLHKLVGLP